MKQFGDCPYGFEDGYVVSYSADEGRLQVKYEFWNERIGLFTFDGFRALHDHFAIGTTIGSARAMDDSELIRTAINQEYQTPPERVGLVDYVLVDTDGIVVLEVVASGCHFVDQDELARSTAPNEDAQAR